MRLDRELLFDRLWMAVEACPYLARIIPAEYKDLQRGDIPFFSTFPNSLHVWTSTNQCIPDLIDQPSLSIVEGKLRSLSEGNLSLQRWLIRASLATAGPANGLVPRQPNPTADSPQSSFDRDKVLGAACAVADRLESLAICWDESASWINLTAVDERRWSITPSLLDLYDGLPGIALFLAYVGHITGKNRYSDLAHKTCNTVLRRLEEYKSIDRRIGAFAGWGGLIYAFTHLGSLWQEAGLLDKAEGMIQGLPGLITGDEAFDIIEGSAGCIGTLIASYRQRRSPQTLAAAKACGEHLIANAKSMPNGVGWIIPKQTVPLAGFAHGAAGVAWALHQLYDLTGEEIFRKAAAEAIAYESTLFDPEEGNWRDLRTSNASSVQGNHSSMSAWCHGATGIGLSRLATLEKHPDDQVAQEVDTSLKTTIWAGLGHNHSLCHGDLGNIDLLLQTSRVLKSERWNREAQRVASSVAQSIFQNEYRCGTPLNVDSPGLMTGLAGIGYGLLRVAEPERVPSVLTLQPVFEA